MRGLLLLGCLVAGGGVPDRAAFDAAADYAARSGGVAALVMVDGRVLFERYEPGHTAETPVHLHSGTKGFWSAGCAAMLEDGLFTLDERVADTITEWQDTGPKSRITVRHLLQLNSGLQHDIPMLQGFDGRAADKYAHAVGLGIVARPGSHFSYGPGHYYALGAFMQRKLKGSPLDYLKRRVLDPIGVKIGDWKHDPSGNPHIPNGAYLTAREWAKFGQFLLQRGQWKGTQVVAERWMQACLEPSDPNPGFGLSLWLNRVGGKPSRGLERSMQTGTDGGFIYPDGHPDMFAALGAGKCRMYMFPALNMVVVRQCDVARDRYQDVEFLRRLLAAR